jgi:hemerythrin-like metal-binding protein
MRDTYFVSWKPQYSVHIDTIDSQHKALVALIRELQEAMWEGRGRAFQNTLIDQLVAYTKGHLRFEEAMMSENAYEFLAEHAEQHRVLTSQVCELQQQIHDGEAISNAYLMLFLRNWLLAHIMKHDQKFARSLRATAQPEEPASPAPPSEVAANQLPAPSPTIGRSISR